MRGYHLRNGCIGPCTLKSSAWIEKNDPALPQPSDLDFAVIDEPDTDSVIIDELDTSIRPSH